MKSRFFNSRCHSKRNLCHELLWCCICGKFCPFNVFWLVTDMRCVPKLKSTWDSTKNKPGLWKSYSQFQIWRPFHPGAVSSVFTMCFNFHQQHTPKSNKFGTHTGKWNLMTLLSILRCEYNPTPPPDLPNTHTCSVPCWSLHSWPSSPSRFCLAAGCRCRRIPRRSGRVWRTWGGSHGSFHWLWTQRKGKVVI